MDRRPPTRSLSDISLGQILRGLSRYKPVGVVVLGILVVAVLAPAPGGPDGGSTVAQGGGAQGGFQPQGPGPSEATPAPTPSGTPSIPAPPGGGSEGTSTPEPTPAPTEPPSDPDPGPTFGDDLGDDSDGDEGSDEPLRVTGWGWASQGSGTPLASADVPDGTLPVGKRADQIDKASFVRLEGSGFELELAEDPDGSRGVEDPVVQACEITEPGWAEEQEMSFEEAPEWDPDACASGTPNDDGTWTFALAAFAPASEGPGFALVPGPEAPVDFQVTFEAP